MISVHTKKEMDIENPETAAKEVLKAASQNTRVRVELDDSTESFELHEILSARSYEEGDFFVRLDGLEMSTVRQGGEPESGTYFYFQL